jgi:hypothetical protein
VLIGESGLSALRPDLPAGRLTVAVNAERGARHAVWAGLVSGSMNGRSLYWEDGFGIYFPALEWPFLEKYADIETAARRFSQDVDFAGFRPLAAQRGSSLIGAALGNERMVLGWFRDAGSEPPDWPLREVVSGESVTLTVPGEAPEWNADFYDTKTGEKLSSAAVARSGGTLTLTLPDFQDDIAFKLYPVR